MNPLTWKFVPMGLEAMLGLMIVSGGYRVWGAVSTWGWDGSVLGFMEICVAVGMLLGRGARKELLLIGVVALAFVVTHVYLWMHGGECGCLGGAQAGSVIAAVSACWALIAIFARLRWPRRISRGARAVAAAIGAALGVSAMLSFGAGHDLGDLVEVLPGRKIWIVSPSCQHCVEAARRFGGDYVVVVPIESGGCREWASSSDPVAWVCFADQLVGNGEFGNGGPRV